MLTSYDQKAGRGTRRGSASITSFHGCSQSAKSVGDKLYAHAGFNRWADTNNLIVLYPQVNGSLLNPQGCWDWFGYTGRDYATKPGPQLAAVKAMTDRLLGDGTAAVGTGVSPAR